MALTIRFKKEAGFKKDFQAFMRELANEARSIDRQEAANGFKASISDSHKDELVATTPKKC